MYKVTGFKYIEGKLKLEVKGKYVDPNNYDNGYYAQTENNNQSDYRIIKTSGAWIHDSKHFTKHNRIQKLKRGQKVKVVKVVKTGGITRLYIGNGQYITSNKTFVQKHHK